MEFVQPAKLELKSRLLERCLKRTIWKSKSQDQGDSSTGEAREDNEEGVPRTVKRQAPEDGCSWTSERDRAGADRGGIDGVHKLLFATRYGAADGVFRRTYRGRRWSGLFALVCRGQAPHACPSVPPSPLPTFLTGNSVT